MKTTITIFILLLNTYFINAQVGIDNTNPQAALDITSTNDGLLIPRVALTNTITATVITPTTSELVYNTATSGTAPNNVIPGFYYWDGSQWVSIKNTINASGDGWSLTGNATTVDGTNFIGTTDDIPFTIKANNQKSGRITSTGQTFFGYQAGNVNTDDTNTGIGFQALFSNTIGFSNTGIGMFSLNKNTSGALNTAIGRFSLYKNTTGNQNTANGFGALFSNTTGFDNTATGLHSLKYNTTGTENTADGIYSLMNSTTGSKNSANGYQTLFSNTTGNFNTAIGFAAGNVNVPNTTGSYNTFLGTNASSDNSNRTNCIAIAGNSNIGFGGDNCVRIGNNSMTSIGGQVTWTTISDERVKENIQNDVKGLDFILKLKPVTYNYSIEKSNKVQNYDIKEDWESKYNIEKIRFSGFLAQEVKRTAQEVGYDFSGVDKPEDANGLWGLRYAEFTVPLVKSVQELHEKNLAIQTENQHLQNQVADLLKRMELQEQTIKTMQSNLNSLNSKK